MELLSVHESFKSDNKQTSHIYKYAVAVVHQMIVQYVIPSLALALPELLC